MPNEPPIDDPQTIWQSQSTEETKMSLTLFRLKAEQLRARARWMAIANDVTYAGVLVFLAFQYAKAPSTISRTGLVLLAVGSFYVVCRAHKRLWPLFLAPDARPDTGLEAYRRELLRSRDHSRDAWRMVAPLIPGCLVVALPVIAPLWRKASANPAILINALPFCVLFAIWLALVFPVRRRRLRNLEREIDILDRLVSTSPEASGQR
jgi:hypothetical protein